MSELHAAAFAIRFGASLAEYLDRDGYIAPNRFHLKTDCLHVSDGIENGNGHKFPRLWDVLNDGEERMVDLDVNVKAKHVPAHTGIPGNEEANRLARRASNNRGRKPYPSIVCMVKGCGTRCMRSAAQLARHWIKWHLSDHVGIGELEPESDENSFHCCFPCNEFFLDEETLLQHLSSTRVFEDNPIDSESEYDSASASASETDGGNDSETESESTDFEVFEEYVRDGIIVAANFIEESASEGNSESTSESLSESEEEFESDDTENDEHVSDALHECAYCDTYHPSITSLV